MDMDRLVRRVSEQLAARPSRRGFVATLAAGTGAALAGLRGPDEAAAKAHKKDSCCVGDPCPSPYQCPKNADPAGYGWQCSGSDGKSYWCQDCYSGSDFICNYTQPR
jgi:hypothetical protein